MTQCPGAARVPGRGAKPPKCGEVPDLEFPFFSSSLSFIRRGFYARNQTSHYNIGPDTDLRSVELGSALILRCQTRETFHDSGRMFGGSVRFGYEEILELLLKDSRVDPSAQNNYAIRFAVKNEHEKMVKLLLKDPRVDPSARYNEAIVTVAKNGNEKIVELLLKDLRVDPSAHDNEAIFYSILYNHEKVAELLLKDSRMELSKKNSHLLLRAVENGYDTVIELLLKNYPIDPTVQDNYALSYAVENGYVKAVELLLKDPRVILYANKSRTFLQTIYSAIKNNHVKIVELLINESKTSKIIKDALIIAKKYNKGDIVKILEAKLKKSL